MEYMAFLSPVAFVFALSAIGKVDTLKKEVQLLKAEIENLKRMNKESQINNDKEDK